MSNRIKREGAIRRLTSNSLYANLPVVKHNENALRKNEKYEAFKKQDQDSLISQIIELESVFNFHRSVMQNVNTGIITLDLNGIVTFANRPAAEILVLDIGDLLNKAIAVIFPNFDFKDYLADLPVSDIEVKYETAKAKNQYIRVNLNSYTDVINKHSGAILSLENITEIVQLRKQMERMDRLATLGEVAKGIAHEIRNPLAGAKSIAQVLEATYETDATISDYTGRIVREIDRANVLLQEFFKFAKPEKPKKSFVEPEAFIEEMIAYFSKDKSYDSINFKADFSHLTPQFKADRVQVEQVFKSLIENAADALKTTDGAEIKITTRKLLHSIAGKKQEMLSIEIADNGIGVKKEDQEKIFNPFYSSKVKNVGLGLSIASRLLEENGGELKLAKNTEIGATFILLLPTS